MQNTFPQKRKRTFALQTLREVGLEFVPQFNAKTSVVFLGKILKEPDKGTKQFFIHDVYTIVSLHQSLVNIY